MNAVLLPSTPLVYNPRLWNDNRVCRLFNCYAYALNTQKFGWASLGGSLSNNRNHCRFLLESFGFENSAHRPVIESLIWLMLDGLKPVRKEECQVGEGHFIAYDVPDRHFYRWDQNGRLSHKFAEQYVTDRDDRNNPIYDLEMAHIGGRGHTPDAGDLLYFRIPDEGMNLMPRTPDELVRLEKEIAVAIDRLPILTPA